MASEFDIITQFFKNTFPQRAEVLHGIGDDAAVCHVPAGYQLVISVDTLVEDVHFIAGTDPEDIAYKALAVNLSDMAAMGASPAWMTLALTTPTGDESWLQRFSMGLRSLAQYHHVALIGGDTTRGALTISIQIMGLIPAQQALSRAGARVGDKIYVTGTLGDAGLGLAIAQQRHTVNDATAAEYLVNRLHRPTPRIEIGVALRTIAHSAIDISDGLAADLQHILTASGVGATLYADKLPLSTELQQNLSVQEAIHTALTAGDDYELCFTVPPAHHAQLEQALQGQPYTCIGEITASDNLQCLDKTGNTISLTKAGYQHF